MTYSDTAEVQLHCHYFADNYHVKKNLITLLLRFSVPNISHINAEFECELEGFI